ncbi:MAG: integration host factor subunit alpha [Magnetococcales bacterium]|nr:integration host factor subunit alpha [Magnetococcales bacterium]
MTTTKKDLVESVQRNAGFSRLESASLVESVFDIITETLENGDQVKLSGFGNFRVRDKRSRVGRNPKSGVEVEISARRVVTFKASTLLTARSSAEDSDGIIPVAARRRAEAE